MTQILKEGGKTIIKTDKRIDTMNASQFEKDIESALEEQGVDLEMDCTELNYISSSGLRILLNIYKHTRSYGHTSTLKGMTEEVEEVFSLSGFLQLFKVEK